jgi:hypothetical protein
MATTKKNGILEKIVSVGQPVGLADLGGAAALAEIRDLQNQGLIAPAIASGAIRFTATLEGEAWMKDTRAEVVDRFTAEGPAEVEAVDAAEGTPEGFSIVVEFTDPTIQQAIDALPSSVSATTYARLVKRALASYLSTAIAKIPHDASYAVEAARDLIVAEAKAEIAAEIAAEKGTVTETPAKIEAPVAPAKIAATPGRPRYEAGTMLKHDWRDGSSSYARFESETAIFVKRAEGPAIACGSMTEAAKVAMIDRGNASKPVNGWRFWTRA